MKVSYRITEDDYVAAVKLGAIPTRKTLHLLLTLFAGLIALGLFGGPVLKAGALGGLVSGTVCYFVIQYLYNPYASRRNYRKYRAIQQEQWLELKTEGIAFASENAAGVVTWEDIVKWRENERFVLVYVMPRLFHVVKKELVGLGFDLEGFRGELVAKVGEAEMAK